MSRFFRGICVIILTLLLTVTVVSANSPPDADPHNASVIILAILLLFLVPAVTSTALTCFAEWMVARFFKIDKSYSKLIIITNLVSQLAVCYLVFSISWLNTLLLQGFNVLYHLILGVPALICEYFVYRKKMIELTDKECLVYTVVANAVSIVLRVLLTYLHYHFLF